MAEPRIVIVGTSKPMLNYVTACITLFNSGCQDVLMRARGEAINVAVEAVQLLKKKFMGDVVISSISIDGDTVKARDGRTRNLPVIEILLTRKRV